MRLGVDSEIPKPRQKLLASCRFSETLLIISVMPSRQIPLESPNRVLGSRFKGTLRFRPIFLAVMLGERFAEHRNDRRGIFAN